MARSWIAEVFGLIIRLIALSVVAGSLALGSAPSRAEVPPALVIFGLGLGLLLLWGADFVVRFSYGKGWRDALRGG
jgi:hypothetical protein